MDDLRGRKFGMLTVLCPVKRGDKVSRSKRWACRCDCGGTHEVRADSLKAGHTIDCGCRKKRRTKTSFTRHGKSGTPIYDTWKNMHARCYRTSYTYYKNYGGRGIAVCDRWHKFENFYADMGDVPPKLQLDRIDNDGNYEPTNCRWATRSQHMLNTRRQRKT